MYPPRLKDDDHRALGESVVEVCDVGEVQDDAAPGESAGAVVGPFARPAVEAYAAAESRRLRCGRARASHAAAIFDSCAELMRASARARAAGWVGSRAARVVA